MFENFEPKRPKPIYTNAGDAWVEDGRITLGYDLQLGPLGSVPSLVIRLLPKNIQGGLAITFGAPPGATLATWDGTNCNAGGTWDQALARGRAVDQHVTPYKIASASGILVHDNEILLAGSRVTFYTGQENFAVLSSFYEQQKVEGTLDRRLLVTFRPGERVVHLTHEPDTLGNGSQPICDTERAEGLQAIGLAFEAECVEILRRHGFVAEITPTTGDNGVDILAELAELRFAIQCKHSKHPVGIKAVQEASAGRQHYLADCAVVVTNASYTTAAYNLARTNGVLLLKPLDLPNMLALLASIN